MDCPRFLKFALCGGFAAAISIALWQYQHAEQPRHWIYWLIWVTMAVHQLEEHVLTELVLGRNKSLLNWARLQGFSLSPGRALLLNCGLGWSLALLSGLVGDKLILIPLLVIAIETVNAFWHLSLTSLQGRWSPGTLSSVFITVPLGFYLFHHAAATTPALSCLAVFVAACLAHHALIRELPRVQPAAAYRPSAESQLLRHSDHRQARTADLGGR